MKRNLLVHVDDLGQSILILPPKAATRSFMDIHTRSPFNHILQVASDSVFE